MVGQKVQAKRKFYKLMADLGQEAPFVRGMLQLMWDQAEDTGSPTFVSAEKVADACWWEENPDRLAETLVKCGFLDKQDDGYVIHDWWDHIPYNAKKKAAAIKFALENGQEVEEGILRWAIRNMPVIRDLAKDLGIEAGEPVPKKTTKKTKETKKARTQDFTMFMAAYKELCRECGSNAGDQENAWKTWGRHKHDGDGDELLDVLRRQIEAGMFNHNGQPFASYLPHASTWLNGKKGPHYATEIEAEDPYEGHSPQDREALRVLEMVEKQQQEDAQNVKEEEVPFI